MAPARQPRGRAAAVADAGAPRLHRLRARGGACACWQLPSPGPPATRGVARCWLARTAAARGGSVDASPRCLHRAATHQQGARPVATSVLALALLGALHGDERGDDELEPAFEAGAASPRRNALRRLPGPARHGIDQHDLWATRVACPALVRRGLVRAPATRCDG